MEPTLKASDLLLCDYFNTYSGVVHGVICGQRESCNEWPPTVQGFSERYRNKTVAAEGKYKAIIRVLDRTAEQVNALLQQEPINIEKVTGFTVNVMRFCEGVRGVEKLEGMIREMTSEQEIH